MAEFLWRAADIAGHVDEGRLEAPSAAVAARQLRDRGLTPVSIREGASSGRNATSGPQSGATGAPAVQRRGKSAVTQSDVMALTSELAIMLRSGLALASALKVLIDMSHKPAVSALVQQVLDDVKDGAPLSRALGREQQVFGDFYLNMVRSGEASGQLAPVLTRLVEHLERIRGLRESVVSATIYPLILLTVAVVSLVAMLGFVVPQFEKLFVDLGDALPMATRIVMKAGHVFRDWGVAIAIGLGMAGWVSQRWLRSPTGTVWWQSRILGLPMLGLLLRKYQLTLFARTLGTLLGNGVPLLTALHISTETVDNQFLRSALLGVAPSVKEGARLVDALSATGIFEPLAINLVRVGEETGRLGPMMLELANILNRDVEIGIRRVLTLLEPLLIIVLGLMIAGIIVSILLGILAINDLAV
jgi:general secretion pathway protein F